MAPSTSARPPSVMTAYAPRRSVSQAWRVGVAALDQPVDEPARAAVREVELRGEVGEAQAAAVGAGEAQQGVELGPGEAHLVALTVETPLEAVVGLDQQADGGDPGVVQGGPGHGSAVYLRARNSCLRNLL